MITTADADWAARTRVLRLHGINKDAWKRYTKEGNWYYEVVEAGYKYNMTDPQAALGLVQLGRVDWLWGERRKIAAAYREAFAEMEGIEVLRVHPDREHAWHLFVILLDPDRLTIDRNGFMRELAGRGIQTSVHFIPLHRQPYYRDACGLDAAAFPGCESTFQRQISLPIFPGMTDAEVAHVTATVGDLLARHRR
jgi:perosamine synthetase